MQKQQIKDPSYKLRPHETWLATFQYDKAKKVEHFQNAGLPIMLQQ